MRAHGLLDAGWTFRFDRARRRFGVCRFGPRIISLSRTLVELNPETECRDTVLHEIAHALAGPSAGHGPKWKAMCLRVGADPRRCYDHTSVTEPDPRFAAECPACGHRIGFHRRPSRRRACASCCRTHANGAYDERFLMRLIDVASGEPVAYASPPAAAIEARCPHCAKVYRFGRRTRTARACGDCCRRFAGGRFDERFRLKLTRRR